MSLLDELAEADVDLDDLKLGDLGIDPNQLGWLQVNGTFCQVLSKDDRVCMNIEEDEWLNRVLDSCRKIHATAVVRIYICKRDSNVWEYSKLFGGAAICTESNLQMSCAHFIRIVDLDGFNPNTSIMVQQELYPGFEYLELTPFFHAFEMSKYMCGLSFCSEEEAKNFAENVRYCMSKSAQEIVETMMDLDERLTRKKKDDLDAKEKTYRLVGDSGWRQANEGMSVKVAKKYAAGGITDGTEVRWAKKADLPPELAAALGMNAPKKSAEEPTPGPPENVIDLLRDPKVRSRTIVEMEKGKSIGDGVNMVWAKNKTPLTGTNAVNVDAAAALLAAQQATTAPMTEKEKKKSFSLFGKKKK